MANINLLDLKPGFDLSSLEEISTQEAEQIRGGELWGWEANGGGALREMNIEWSDRIRG